MESGACTASPNNAIGSLESVGAGLAPTGGAGCRFRIDFRRIQCAAVRTLSPTREKMAKNRLPGWEAVKFRILLLGSQLLFQPVLAGDEALNDEADDVVACSVDHGCRGIHQVTDGDQDGECQSHLISKEDGADDVLADVAAAGNAGHAHGGQNSNQDDGDQHIQTEVLAEYAEYESDLQNAGEAGAVHVHGCAQGQNHIRDVLGDAGISSSFHVGGDGSDGGAGAQGNHSGLQNVAEHLLGAILAAADPCKQGEGSEYIDGAQGVVGQQAAGIVGGDLGAVGSHQVSEEAEEGDGGVVADDLDELQHHIAEVFQPLGNGSVLAAVQVHSEAEQDGEDDQRQHGAAAQQANEVFGGEEVDDQGGKACILAHFLAGDLCPGLQDRGEHLHDEVHDKGSDGTGDDESADGNAHDLACALTVAHVCHGAGDGREDHGNHDTEHHVDEQGAQRLQQGGLGPQSTDNTAGYDGCQHDQGRPIVFPKVLHKKPP